MSEALSYDVLEFLLRINRTFVNREGSYFKFEFYGTSFTEPRLFEDQILRYCDREWHVADPFKEVRCDENDEPSFLEYEKYVQLPTKVQYVREDSATLILNQAPDYNRAFIYGDYTFVGTITSDSGDFRHTDPVVGFFDEYYDTLGPNCYVDEVGTTYFVLSDRTAFYSNDDHVEPEYI